MTARDDLREALEAHRKQHHQFRAFADLDQSIVTQLGAWFDYDCIRHRDLSEPVAAFVLEEFGADFDGARTRS